jgi:ATP-dependent DNA helicase RecG
MVLRRLSVKIHDNHIIITTDFDAGDFLRSVPTYKANLPFGGLWSYEFIEAPIPALALRYAVDDMRKVGVVCVFHGNQERLSQLVNALPSPKAFVESSSQRAIISAPRIPLYVDLMRKCSATARSDGSWSIPIEKIRDFVILSGKLPDKARIDIDDSLHAMLSESLPSPYDGSADSLRKLPLSTLRVVRGNVQPSYKALKIDRSSIETKFHKMGVDNLYDLLFFRPKKYIDRSEPQFIQDLNQGETATVVGKIINMKTPSSRLLVITIEDKTGETIDCVFFNMLWLQKNYKMGDEVIATGSYQVKEFHGHQYPQLAQPELDLIDAAGVLPIMPVYSTPAKIGLTSAIVMHCEQELVNRLGDRFTGPAWSEDVLSRHHISSMTYGLALKTMHLPKNTSSMAEAKKSLAFCEMIQLMVYIENERRGQDSVKGIPQSSSEDYLSAYLSGLPYKLTGAQEHAISIITKGMSKPQPLHALLVGDVGSGKTTVMHMAALAAVNAGHQAVICAPTEILAHQLYDVFIGIVESMPSSVRERIHAVYHAGYKGKGAAKARRENIAAVANGEANVVFGTHSVLNIEYHDLTFVGVDEQHKFGAAQRSRLLSVRSDGKIPDMLMQTATPIPRSMAQVFFGDITYIALDELPAGRIPIETVWVKKKGEQVINDKWESIWKDVNREATLGHGTFIVAPMVEDNEKLAAASVKKTFKRLQEILPDVTIGMVYSSQNKGEQDSTIEGFKNGTIDVLVASSVVEVGVSCEKATRMIILDANRFGLASLHQIRGRIGRSNLKSVCYLVGMPFNQVAQKRLQVMVDTLNGWELSKTDMMNRGMGSLFGTAQSGTSDLMFADLSENAKWINETRTEARSILQSSRAQEAIDDARKYFGVEDDILS